MRLLVMTFGLNEIWVIMDRLTKIARFIPMKNTQSMEKLAEAYANKIVRLHGVPKDIMSDRDPRFLPQFQVALKEAFGTQMKLSIPFNVTIDGQMKRTIKIVEDMLCACTLEFQHSLETSLSLMEFSYNNSYHASIHRLHEKLCVKKK